MKSAHVISIIRWTFVVSIASAPLTLGMAQGSAGTSGGREPRYLVDVPTAGMLAQGTVGLDVDFFQEGGLLLGVNVGILSRLSLGVSYGGSRLIGSEKASMNSVPGANVKLRVLEENIVLPAVALGFDSQGRDGYIKELDRYKIKSPGFYVVGSKNYALAGFISVHGGINYSLERGDGDRDVNFFFGFEKTIGPVVSFVAEYNLGSNDSNGSADVRGRGYLNIGVRLSIGGGLTLGADLKDLAKNRSNVSVGNRTVRIEYLGEL